MTVCNRNLLTTGNDFAASSINIYKNKLSIKALKQFSFGGPKYLKFLSFTCIHKQCLKFNLNCTIIWQKRLNFPVLMQIYVL